MEFVDKNGNTVTCTVGEYLALSGIKAANAPPMEFGGGSLGKPKRVRKHRRYGKNYEEYAQKAYRLIRDSESPMTLNKLMEAVGLAATNMSQRKHMKKALKNKLKGTDVICVKKHKRVNFGKKQAFAGKKNLPPKPMLKKPKKNAYLSFRSQRIKELMKPPYKLDYMNASKRASEEYGIKHPKSTSGNYNPKIKPSKNRTFMGKAFNEHMMQKEAEASVEWDGGTYTRTEGQDRKTYSDTKDKETYIPEDKPQNRPIVETFPEFKTLSEGGNKLIEMIIKNMIASHGQITMPNEGMMLELTEGKDWGAFCQEFEALSDRISKYFAVEDRFVKRKLIGKYNYIECEVGRMP